MSLPYRQVHLDFHTSEHIEGIGSRFTREGFKAALKAGNINSITLFSKCHHGWSYHPTKVNKMHPHLDFDLLGEQLAVCKELGIRTELYFSGGLDEKYAREHRENLTRNKEGAHRPFTEPCWHRICFNTPYLDFLCEQIDEAMTLYKGLFDGIFIDIIGALPCYCDHCKADMLVRGIDICDDKAVMDFAYVVYQKYCDAIDRVVHKHDPNMPIIHNDGGAIYQGRHIAFRNTRHFELESLPTGGWGYDHFPRAAAYARTLGKEFIGMTGKFHRSWGEFGGFKHPNALRYETALSNACGGGCSIGDQLHPDGEFDMSTYRLIGQAYREVEAREPYLSNSKLIADIGLISAEACVNSPYAEDFDKDAMFCNKYRQDLGANRIMLEGHYLYDILDPDADFSSYKLLVLPDNISVNGKFKEKLDAYLANGGKLLFSGSAGTDKEGNFAFDFGLRYNGKAELQPSYLKPKFDLYPNGITSYIMYGTAHSAELTDGFSGRIRAERVEPYFNRAAEHFCSHVHTPYDRQKVVPAAFLTDNIGYIAWDIFSEYADVGAVHLRALVTDMIDGLLGENKTLSTTLGSVGVTSLARQITDSGERLVHHLLYAIPKVRGKSTEIIEDLTYVLDTKVTVKTDKKPSRIYTAPDGCELDFTCENGKVIYTVPKFSCAILAVIEF